MFQRKNSFRNDTSFNVNHHQKKLGALKIQIQPKNKKEKKKASPLMHVCLLSRKPKNIFNHIDFVWNVDAGLVWYVLLIRFIHLAFVVLLSMGFHRLFLWQFLIFNYVNRFNTCVCVCVCKRGTHVFCPSSNQNYNSNSSSTTIPTRHRDGYA